MSDICDYHSQQSHIERLEKRVVNLLQTNNRIKKRFAAYRKKYTRKTMTRSDQATQLIAEVLVGKSDMTYAEIANITFLSVVTVQNLKRKYINATNK